ncbi:transposase [Micromonospora inositola]|uniref:transposase n=1 Tax=Micromonospora inositola TaxID=47865 RepID=UPI000B5ACAC4
MYRSCTPDSLASAYDRNRKPPQQIHLLVNFPSTVALSQLVNSLKGVSSRQLRQQFPDLVAHYRANRLRSGTYIASSAGGAPLTVLPGYIEQQTGQVRARSGLAGPPARAFTPRPEGRSTGPHLVAVPAGRRPPARIRKFLRPAVAFRRVNPMKPSWQHGELGVKTSPS